MVATQIQCILPPAQSQIKSEDFIFIGIHGPQPRIVFGTSLKSTGTGENVDEMRLLARGKSTRCNCVRSPRCWMVDTFT